MYLSGYSLLHDANRAALIPWLATIPPETPVFFDPGPLVADIPSTALEPVLARTTWLSCNATEAKTMTGLADPIAAAEALITRIPGVLVRDGAGGCVLGVRGGGVVKVAGFAVAAVDLNGAGDAHAGAFLAGIAEGKEPMEAARWANAAAALAVTRRGPATGPSRSELEGFLRAY